MDTVSLLLAKLAPEMLLPLRIVLIALLSWLAWRLARRLTSSFGAWTSNTIADPEDLKRATSLVQVFRYLTTVFIFSIFVLLVLSELDISIAPILGAAGVVGVAVGFGAQSLIKDYFSGFFLLLENQMRQGDVVRIADIGGVVEEITLRYVQLRDYDGNVHFIPNGGIGVVTNMTHGHAFAVIDVGVAYDEDIDAVIALMREVGAALRADPAWRQHILEDIDIAGLDKLADSALVLRCRFKTAPIQQWGVRREYLRRLKYAFDAAGVKIPYPHLTICRGDDFAAQLMPPAHNGAST